MQTGIYRHFKGGHYQVLGVARHSETNELMVVYVSLEGMGRPGPRMAVRPYEMFNGFVEVGCDGGLDHVCGPGCDRSVPRFTHVGDELPR